MLRTDASTLAQGICHDVQGDAGTDGRRKLEVGEDIHREIRGQAPSFLVLYSLMARLPRVVIVDVAHHVAQRGNGRQRVLASEALPSTPEAQP